MRLIALKPLRYVGKKYLPADEEAGRPADEFDAKDKDANILIAVKKARPVPERAELPPPPPVVAAVIGPDAAARVAEEVKDRLRSKAEELGIETDGRWGAARLEEEIAKVEGEREAEKERLRAEAEALGVDIDGRWGVARLQEEIEAAKEERAASADQAAEEAAS